MYAAIWRALPGPTWLKFIEALILVGVIVVALFQWFYPWLMEVTNLSDTTVNQ